MESSEVLHTIGKQTASDTVWYDRDCANARAGARERTRVQHLAQHLEQQSQPGNATQQAQEAATQPEVVALNNHMELRRSEEQKKDP